MALGEAALGEAAVGEAAVGLVGFGGLESIDMCIYFDDMSTFSESGARVLSILRARDWRVCSVGIFSWSFVFILMTLRNSQSQGCEF